MSAGETLFSSMMRRAAGPDLSAACLFAISGSAATLAGAAGTAAALVAVAPASTIAST